MFRPPFIILLSSLSILLITSSCDINKIDENHIVNNRSCSIAIEGMMCEKGCKTTIQNKLSEMEGVIHCEVDYDLRQAFITYDGNKVSAQDFITKINSIADGLYKAILIEDKDIENAPVEMEHSEANPIESVSYFNMEVPNFLNFFQGIIQV